MIRFIKCPKCEASIENVPGTVCWNCGHIVRGGSKVNQAPSNVLDIDAQYYDLDDQTFLFKSCSKCGAQNEKYAVNCWECGQAFEGLGGADAGDVHASPSPKKKVPFGDIVAKPPEEKEKKGIVGKISDVLKPGDSEGPSPEQLQKEKERKMKKERRLILFHCLKCGDYFKVLFRKVRAEVKCPVCKSLMKISYFCTKCKCTEEYSKLGRHVCPRCNLDMILDPNFE